jgi:hypothetical protein
MRTRDAFEHQWNTIPELRNPIHGAEFFAAPALLLEMPDREFAIIDGEIDARLRRGEIEKCVLDRRFLQF